MKKLLENKPKIKRYKFMNNILILIGVIFFFTSIAVKVNITVKSLSKKKDYSSSEFDSKFNETYKLMCDGLIHINEALLGYSIQIDNTNNKKAEAENILKNEKKKLINSLEFKTIENEKKEIDKQIYIFKANSNNANKLKLLYEFYNFYCEYYFSLINIEGTCDEYILKLRNIEQNAIEIGNKINNF